LTLSINTFKGLRNDKGLQYVPPQYFYDIENFNYDSIIGADKIKNPTVFFNGGNSNSVDGIFEFKFLDTANVLQTEKICMINGVLSKDWDTGTLTLIDSGFSTGLVSFAVYRDKLIFANGSDYTKVYNGAVVYDFGAPSAEIKISSGNLNGDYYYEMTYVTAGGEERIGARSNTISTVNQQVTLTLPLGYDGTTSRKIYRTTGGGSVPMLVTTIADNTTLTYTDNIADGSLTDIIIDVNNETPKPYFLEVSDNRLIATVSDLLPTQIWATDADIEVIDNSNASDISNISGDNTPVVGMERDYNRIIVGSEKDIYIVDASGTDLSVTETRSNLGVKDGYTMKKVPANEDFPGGVMFVSTLDDIRVFSGNFAQPIATSLDNLTTNNWSRIIQRSLRTDIQTAPNMFALFHDYKYHLVLGKIYYAFDIRGLGWTRYKIQTTNFSSFANCLAIADESMFIGQIDADIIEKAYQRTLYRSEAVSSFIHSPQMLASESLKYIKYLRIHYSVLSRNKFDVTIILDGDEKNKQSYPLDFKENDFMSSDFSQEFFNASGNQEDYREFYIDAWARWIQVIIDCDSELFLYRGFTLVDNQGEEIEIQ